MHFFPWRWFLTWLALHRASYVVCYTHTLWPTARAQKSACKAPFYDFLAPQQNAAPRDRGSAEEVRLGVRTQPKPEVEARLPGALLYDLRAGRMGPPACQALARVSFLLLFCSSHFVLLFFFVVFPLVSWIFPRISSLFMFFFGSPSFSTIQAKS